MCKKYRDLAGPKGLPRNLKIRLQERVNSRMGAAFFSQHEEALVDMGLYVGFGWMPDYRLSQLSTHRIRTNQQLYKAADKAHDFNQKRLVGIRNPKQLIAQAKKAGWKDR